MTTPNALHLELHTMQSVLHGLRQQLGDIERGYQNLDPDSLSVTTGEEQLDAHEAHAAVRTRVTLLLSTLENADDALYETLPYTSRLQER